MQSVFPEKHLSIHPSIVALAQDTRVSHLDLPGMPDYASPHSPSLCALSFILLSEKYNHFIPLL